MAILTSILATDIVSSTRSVINTNFQNINEQTRVIYKSSNQSIATSVLTADMELNFPIAANEAWQVRLYMPFSAPTVPDMKYTFLVPTGATGYFADDDSAQTANVPSAIGQLTGSSGDRVVGINGVFINNSVAGNIAFYWAQNTDTVSSVSTVYKGANIIATKLN